MATVNKKHKHPSHVDLGFIKYEIVQKSLIREDCYGYVDFCKNTVTVDPSLDSRNYKWTLLHELFHIGYHLFGLGSDEDMPQMGNEYLTTASSNMVQSLWGLNRELFDFIFSGDGNEKN